MVLFYWLYLWRIPYTKYWPHNAGSAKITAKDSVFKHTYKIPFIFEAGFGHVNL